MFLDCGRKPRENPGGASKLQVFGRTRTVPLDSFTTLPTGPCKVSASFQELLKATASSPWSFSAVAAQCFGLDVAPLGLYNTFKLALLLSLVQTGADAKGIFHNLDLLVATTDAVIPERYMRLWFSQNVHVLCGPAGYET